jgi:hypothetical protein
MKCLCLNIDSDTESWRITQEQCAKVGLKPERVSAVVEDNRPMAFNKSVYKAMKYASHENGGFRFEDLLLLEDDVMFDGDFNANDLGPLRLGYLPEDFMTLHLGANIIGVTGTVWQMPTDFNFTIAKLHNCWQSHATLYSAECVKFILDNFNPNVMDADHPIFDEWLRLNVLNQGRSYLLNPMIAYQRPRHSEIWNVAADYTGAHKQGNEWLKRNL